MSTVIGGLVPIPKAQFFDLNGDPLAGGLLYTYEGGTTSKLVTYTSATLATPNSNPVVLDSEGRANIWLKSAPYILQAYKFRLANAADVTVWTADIIRPAGLVARVVVVPIQTAIDLFNRANNASLGSDWTVIQSGANTAIDTNRLALLGLEALGLWTAAPFTAPRINQFAEMIYSTTGDGGFGGGPAVYLNGTTVSNYSGYSMSTATVFGGSTDLVRSNAGVTASLANLAHAPIPGALYRIEARTISTSPKRVDLVVTENGNPLFTYSDTDQTFALTAGGWNGFLSFLSGGGQEYWNSWGGGDLQPFVTTAIQGGVLPIPKVQFFDDLGVPLAGGKVYTSISGSATPLASYTSATLATPNANPVVLDAAGRANIWLGPGPYRIRLDSPANVTLWSVDGILPGGLVYQASPVGSIGGVLPMPQAQFFNDLGNPLVGGKVYTYRAGGVVPLASFTDASLSVKNTNPVILDGEGRANIWMSFDQPNLVGYKIRLDDMNDVTLWTTDVVNPGGILWTP